MNRKRKKRKKEQPIEADKRDKRAEKIVYAFLILLMIIGVVMGYKMSQEFAGTELQENGHFKKNEKEK